MPGVARDGERESSSGGGQFVVLGSLNMDLVARVASFPRAGETVAGEDLMYLPGGKGANQAAALARLGASVRLAGCVGHDVFGDTLRASLQHLGVDVTDVRIDPQAATGVALIVVDAGGENRIIVTAGANGRVDPEGSRAIAAALRPEDSLLMQLEIPIGSVSAAAASARERGARVILNAAPARPLPSALLPLIDVLIVNETEAAALAGESCVTPANAARVAGCLRRRGPGLVAITLGEAGAVVAYQGGTVERPAPRVDVVDTTAAGDAFVGGFAAALGRTGDPALALAEGVAAGSAACRRLGAQPSLPDRREVEELLR
ncbi:MAG: ribokinase [Planctomycetota bacterium]